MKREKPIKEGWVNGGGASEESCGIGLPGVGWVFTWESC